MVNRPIALRRTLIALPLSLAVLGMTGCGTTTSQRALSGAGIGAATGAAGAAVTGGDVGTALALSAPPPAH